MNKNKKGFTLIELIAVIVVLGIIVGIALIFTRGSSDKSKEHAEEIFTNTLGDAVNIYLDSERFNLSTGGVSWISLCNVSIDGSERSFSKLSENKSFDDIIRSSYSPISEDSLINPVNKEQCDVNGNNISLYKDDLMNQYYYFTLDCLEYSNEVTNLPKEFLTSDICDIKKEIPKVYITRNTSPTGKVRYRCSEISSGFYSEFQLCYNKADGGEECLDIHEAYDMVPDGASNVRCRGRINSSSSWVYSSN